MVFLQPVPRGRDGNRFSRILVLTAIFAAFLREMRDMTKLTGDLAAPEWSFVQGPASWTPHGRSSKTSCHQVAKDVPLPTQLLSEAEVRHVHAAVRAKCLEAIAVGNLPPGRELELISALDLGTVPWSLVPIKLKEQLGLPLEDKGIDSLALNLSVAVQAKDYSSGNSVPLNRLTNFYFMVQAKGSPLRKWVKQLVVATNTSSSLPHQWQWSEAVHRQYSADEIEAWRRKARVAQQHEAKVKVPKTRLKRWPHQVVCLKKCHKFLTNSLKKDFFVQMATGAGKSLVMADLLAGLGAGKRSCIIVPKLDLMEQLAQLLEETLSAAVARVGTRHPADLGAEVFVCVRNSAWQLTNLSFDLLILDEAHHYEPEPSTSTGMTASVDAENCTVGIHANQVLALNAEKRIFFTATFLRNTPDFDFSLRPAVEAGIIKDYAVMVPVLSEGDPRPGLIEIIQNLPLSRKILAFCNTICEAKHFTKMLCTAGIPADHYNASTTTSQRQDILKSFQRSERQGGIRVLVTVDVLSEGVDIPIADTCLFVAPRRGVRLQQCVGRVLRNHSGKVDALVVAPPVVQHVNGTLAEDRELERLLGELARTDHVFQNSLGECEMVRSRRVGVLLGPDIHCQKDLMEEAASVLRISVFPSALKWLHSREDSWEIGFAHLQAYKAMHGHVRVPIKCTTADGFKLGNWVSKQRQAEIRAKLSCKQKLRLEELGFVWRVRRTWDDSFQKLQAYKAEHGDVLVPMRYQTFDGFGLGSWVCEQRRAEIRAKLSCKQKLRLEELGFVWRVRPRWDDSFQKLQAYKAEHGDVLVPMRYQTFDGFGLGSWVREQRRAEAQGKLQPEQKLRLEELGFVWRVRAHLMTWDDSFQKLQAYKAEHGDVLVPWKYRTFDGFGLGSWVCEQRRAEIRAKLSCKQKLRLEELGFVWRVRAHLMTWDDSFQKLQAYKAEHGDVLVPWKYRTFDGVGLGAWVCKQRKAEAQGKLQPEKKLRLEELGFVWRVRPHLMTWDDRFQKLQAYKAEHGDVLVPMRYHTFDGFGLGSWVREQRKAEAGGKLQPEQKLRLEELGFVWRSPFLRGKRWGANRGKVVKDILGKLARAEEGRSEGSVF